MSEVSDACQIVMISGKMITASANMSLKAAMLMMKIYNSLYLGKWKGKTAFQRFRAIKGDDYEFINICSEDPEKLMAIEKEMEAHNLLFAKLPDLCGGDGNTQYVIARSDLNIFAAFLMDHMHGDYAGIKVGPIAESDYANTAVHPESGEYTEEFQDLNESARQAFTQERLQLTATRKERPLQLPLFTEKTVTGAEEEVVDMPANEEIKTLTVTRYGRQEETTFEALLLDPQIRLRNEIFKNGNQIDLLYDEPLREGEKWAAFPVHDGFHIVVVPKDDLLSGNLTRKKQVRSAPIEKAPTAMLYTNKNYVVMDLRSQEKSICDGQSVIDMLKAPAPAKEKESLINLEKNIEKNAGAGALLPEASPKRSGR